MEFLKFRVLGSAACEGVPAFFCSCPVCEKARRDGGRDRRSRTAYAVGESVRIDFGPDAWAQSIRFNLRGEALRHLFITHSHEDHFYFEDLCGLDKFDRKLNVYGNPTVIERLKQFRTAGKMIFHELAPGMEMFLQEVQVTVTVLAAAHVATENALLYLLERNARRVLIGNDSGFFPELTFRLLAGKRCSRVFLDCTWGALDRQCGHMGLPDNLRVMERLRNIGAADFRTRFHPIHLGHRYGISEHAEFAAQIAGFGGSPAYDGQTFDF